MNNSSKSEVGPRRGLWSSRRFRLVLGLLAFGAVLGAGRGLVAWAERSPFFALQTLQVEGLARATERSVVKLAGLNIGENLFSLSTSEIEAAVLSHPWVAEAQVSRRLPGTLIIAVKEHQPAALVALGNLFYADASGKIVKRYAPGERVDLPVITGLTREEVETDDNAQTRIAQAIQFAADARVTLGDASLAFAEIHLEPSGGLSFVEAGSGLRVSLGPAPWEPRLIQLRETKRALVQRGLIATHVRVDGVQREDRVVVRPLDGAAKPALARVE